MNRRTLIAATVFTPIVLVPPWVAEGKERTIHWQTWTPGTARPDIQYAYGACGQKRFTEKMVGFLMDTYGDCYVLRVTV